MQKEFYDPDLGSRLILADRNPEFGHYNGESFFKILWNRGNPLALELDAQQLILKRNELISLTPLQEPDFPGGAEEYYLLLFNREFYCIHENDREVSCEGILFWGSSELPVLSIDETELPRFEALFQVFIDELDTRDKIQGEMLRMLLKRLIIKSTRLARAQHFPDDMGAGQTDLIRRFNVLVEQHFKEYHQVNEYAELLHKSPKTLANVFAAAGHKSPMGMIHYRIALEAKRQLAKTDKLAKEIAFDLGFEEPAHFSRFFKKETGKSPSGYREEVKTEG